MAAVKVVGAFYPMANANWFVDKAYTVAHVEGDGLAKKLIMEIGEWMWVWVWVWVLGKNLTV